MTKPAHYGGNKIPASYLKRFLPSQGQETHEEMPWELRVFLNGMGVDNRLVERHTDQHG